MLTTGANSGIALTTVLDGSPADLDADPALLVFDLPSGTGRNGKLSKALVQPVQYGSVKPFGGAVEAYWVRAHVPAVSERHLDRAGPRVRQPHDHLMAAEMTRVTP